MSEITLEGAACPGDGSQPGNRSLHRSGTGAAGADIVINHLPQDDPEEVVSEIRRKGRIALSFGADVSNEEQVRAMFRKVVEEFSPLDILVNNAGVQLDSPFLEMSLEHWQSVLNVNLTGAFLCAREAAREFCRRGVIPERSKAAGKIIFISSVHQAIPWAGHANDAGSTSCRLDAS